MLYNNTHELLQILKNSNLWAKKKLGQNFLVNTQVIDKILEAAQVNDQDFVLEIGPGVGILTQELLKKAKQVESIELDQDLIPHLKLQFAHAKNFTLTHADALKTVPPNHPYKLVANIPYYITSPILNHYLKPKSPSLRPQVIVLLVQKEVAEKVCSKQGDHSVLSLQVQAFGKPEIVCKVSASSFYPAPNVDSAVIKITPYPEPLIKDPEKFFKVIHATFGQKRKTLSNSLKNNLHLSAQDVEKSLNKASIAPQARPQELSLEDWQRLVESIN